MPSSEFISLYTTTDYPFIFTKYRFTSREDMMAFDKDIMIIKSLADRCADSPKKAKKWMKAISIFSRCWGTTNIPVDIFSKIDEFRSAAGLNGLDMVAFLNHSVDSNKISIVDGPWMKANRSETEWTKVRCRVVVEKHS